MKIYNTNTKQIEEIRYDVNGCDCLGDLHGNSAHGNKWNDENECWEMTAEDVSWWNQYVTDCQRADQKKKELMEAGHDVDEVEAAYATGGDVDMEDSGNTAYAALCELEG